ncbi:hypothetical protein [Sulfurospirillum sp. 1612]|uniref:hypothetical protein n=1 Tax=Sulfurospirillum sp. 1612 TaxID=3094835 RepID=UPI002F92E862
MHLLLINNNPAVSKLINLSAEKLGYEIDEISDDSVDLEKSFDITITDSDSVDESSFLLLKESGSLGKVVYIGSRGIEKPEFADYMLYKPFLPTDFVELLKQIGKTIEDETGDTTAQEDVIDDFPVEAYVDDSEMTEPKEMEDAKEGLDLDDLDIIASVPNELLKFDDDLHPYEEDDLDTQDVEENYKIEDETIEAINQDYQEDTTPAPSILDRDDVDQVKQLLEDEETFQNDEVLETEDEDEGIQIAQMDEDVDEDDSLKFEEDDESESMFDFENTDAESPLEFEEELPELSLPNTEESAEKNSIDDLSEEDLAGIFEEDLKQAQASLQTAIMDDVKKVLGKEELKAALKDFKVNISISIDEL